MYYLYEGEVNAEILLRGERCGLYEANSAMIDEVIKGR